MTVEVKGSAVQHSTPEVQPQRRVEVGRIFGSDAVKPESVIETPEQMRAEIYRQWFRREGNA